MTGGGDGAIRFWSLSDLKLKGAAHVLPSASAKTPCLGRDSNHVNLNLWWRTTNLSDLLINAVVFGLVNVLHTACLLKGILYLQIHHRLVYCSRPTSVR